MRKLTTNEKVYLAGVLDFSGKIELERQNPNDTFAGLKITLYGENVPVLSYLKSITDVGQVVRIYHSHKLNEVSGGIWKVKNNKDCIAILKAILPYVKNSKKYTHAKYLIDNFLGVSKKGRYNEKQTIQRLSMEEGFFRLLI